MQPIKGPKPFAQRKKLPEHVFATIKGFNEAGLELMDRLGENLYALSHHHRKFISVKPTESETPPLCRPGDDSSENGLPEPAPWNAWEGAWKIILDHMKVSETERSFSLTIGRGTSRLGTTRGVDLLTSAVGEPSMGVLPVHAIIAFNTNSGYLTIENGDDQNPVRYMQNNRPVPLRSGQRQVFSETDNIFFLGQAALILTYPDLNETELAALRQARNTAFKKAGHSAPDSRLPLFPNGEPVRKFGSIIVHKYVDSGGFGIVGVGVDVSTGDPCAVKTMSIKKLDSLRGLHNELEVLLAFAGKVGLLQAWSICCDHGKHFGPGQHDEVKEAFSTCSMPDHIHIVMALAIASFGPIKWNEYTLPQIIKIAYGILQGLLILHAAGYMHRDITVRNMLLMPGNPPYGVLNDYGKTIKAEYAVDDHTGPAYSRAPEVNGQDYYTNVIDVWSCGQAFGDIIVKKFYHSNVLRKHNLSESHRTPKQTMALMNQLRKKSDPLYGSVVDIIISMLEPNRLLRPSIPYVVERWSRLISDEVSGVHQTEYDVGLVVAHPAQIPQEIKPPMAPRGRIRQYRPPGYGLNSAGSSLLGDDFGSALRGREVGKIMRSGGGAFTPINKPSKVPNPPAQRHGWEHSLDWIFEEPINPASRTGYKVPTLRPLPEADEEAVRAPGTGAKRTWDDRNSEDAGPEGKAAKLG